MGKIFVSHSKHDKDLVKSIKMVIENIGHMAYLYEYESHPEDTEADEVIESEIRNSDFLFCFLTTNIAIREHTKSWIISEVAIAHAYNKRIFVFEKEGDYVDVRLPYLTDYMIFDNENIKHILRIQELAKKTFEELYSPPPEIIGGGLGALIGSIFGPLGTILGGIGGAAYASQFRPVEPSMMRPTCQWCNLSFNYYSPWIKTFPCPKCRRWMEVR